VLYFEKKLKRQGCGIIIGVDEAGRGPLAGPVVAAAIVLKCNTFKNRVDDSKQLSARQREQAFLEISNKSLYAAAFVNEQVIDRVNIYQATRLAMESAVVSLLEKISLQQALCTVHIIVDGTMRLDVGQPCTAIVKGDNRSLTIASASIVAKVLRDRVMAIYDRVYPQYGFARHKGYATGEHYSRLREWGPSPIHRRSFSLAALSHAAVAPDAQ
jgi:ribonuclease HII